MDETNQILLVLWEKDVKILFFLILMINNYISSNKIYLGSYDIYIYILLTTL